MLKPYNNQFILPTAFARIVLPRGSSVERPFDLIASEVDVLTELRPEGNVHCIPHISFWN
jgi:hypothetical protein